MSGKSGFVPSDDTDKFERIYEKLKTEKLEEDEAIKFLRYIEDTYEIHNFFMADYHKMESQRSVKPDTYYRDPSRRDPFHASQVYSILLNHLACSTEDEKSTGYSRKLQKYLDHQIRRLEKKMKTNRDFAFLGDHILRHLGLLVMVLTVQNDVVNVVKAYHKFITLNSEVGSSKDGISRFKNDLNQHFPNSLTEYVNDMSGLYDSGIEVFGNNPNLIKGIITAMNLSTDDEPCLILGETGTGKELIAKIIHGFSARRDNNFWAVNCGGFTESLFNSEISGIHWRAASDIGTRLGAFLKACGNDREECGYYVSAHTKGKNPNRREIRFRSRGKRNIVNPTPENLRDVGGTLFLDEINSLGQDLQSKLLRIIQENEVQVVGEDIIRKFHIKLVCASNTSLLDEGQDNKFRKDLYYRIGRGIVRLPALREMRESIIDIVQFKINEISRRIGYENKVRISGTAKKKLERYDWPGNIRELENVIYRSLKNMIIEGESKLRYPHIESLLSRKQETNSLDTLFSDNTYDDIERRYMEYILEKAEGNISEVMRLCGFKSRSPVNRLLRKHQLGA